MNARISPLALLFACLTSVSLFSQPSGLQMKLQLMPDGAGWGVYVKPVGITPSGSTVTASGQVTVIMPLGFEWDNLQNHAGQWQSYPNAYGPIELPDRQVISFGLVQAEPLYPIPLNADEETLLFSFEGMSECPDTLYLIDCLTASSNGLNPDVCPFCPESPEHHCNLNPSPDCLQSNPGNDLSILDFGASPPMSYNFEGNYALFSWNCHDDDNDGIPNAFEYTEPEPIDCGELDIIFEQPENTLVCLGESANFTCVANAVQDNVTSSVWQKSGPNLLNWEAIDENTDNGNFSGFDGPSLQIDNVDALDQFYFRRRITTENCGNFYSEPAKLFVPDDTCVDTSGIHLKLQLMPDGESWGVYARPFGIAPSENTITAGGQITVVMPLGFNWTNLQSHHGQWASDAPTFDPPELPGRQVIQIGLIQAEPIFPVPLIENEETLLLSFSHEGSCPDTLYLMDCKTVLADGPQSDVCPFCPEYDDVDYPHNSQGNNPGNDLGILDFGASPPMQYNYEGNYAPSAWNCHDCDDDGIPNALEDTNGDGQWTPGVDASPLCIRQDFVHLKLQYNSVEKSWGVFMTPEEGFEPTELSELLSGKVVLASSNDFLPGSVQSFIGGEWQLGASLLSSPDNPDLRYFTFDLEPNGVLFDVQFGEELKLFKFKNDLGTCPDALYLLEDSPPNLIEESEITGLSTEGFDEETFGFGGIYGHDAWICELIVGDGSGIGPDSLGNGGQHDFELLIDKKQKRPTLIPNPVSDFLTIKFPPEDTEHPIVVRLLSMHGRTLQRHLAEGRNEMRLDMNRVPSGIYFITFERFGEIIQRERVVKK